MIAFVISTPEISVVNQLSGEGKPYMKGSLFHFTRAQAGDYINDLAAFSTKTDEPELENAALRLAERIGTWLGQNMVAKAEVETATLELPAKGKKGKKLHSGGVVTLEAKDVPVILTNETVLPKKTFVAAFAQSKEENAALYEALED